MYIPRILEQVIAETSNSFKVILLTGARQVGKTTILEHLANNIRSYVTFDDLNVRIQAQADPETFLSRLELPVLIDEVQYVPEIFPYLKMLVDKNQQNGMVWLTGSQQFSMMHNITESLAGRVAILHLRGISIAEEQQRLTPSPFIPSIELLTARSSIASSLTAKELFHKIWRGSYPHVVLDDGKTWERFYESYIATYIQCDIQDHLQIRNTANFYKFLQIAANRSGQILNLADISRDVGVSLPTIKSWIDTLQASGIIYLLQPYFNNRNKRIIKTPKLYFYDTGLCCYLTGWLNSDVLEKGAMAGHMLETYAVTEVIKSFVNAGKMPRVYYYRDKDKKEIDLLIEINGKVHPIEIKKTSAIKNMDIKNFAVLDSLGIEVGHGAVLSLVQSITPINRKVDAVPIGFI